LSVGNGGHDLRRVETPRATHAYTHVDIMICQLIYNACFGTSGPTPSAADRGLAPGHPGRLPAPGFHGSGLAQLRHMAPHVTSPVRTAHRVDRYRRRKRITLQHAAQSMSGPISPRPSSPDGTSPTAPIAHPQEGYGLSSWHSVPRAKNVPTLSVEPSVREKNALIELA
jgi:hypothetical protein